MKDNGRRQALETTLNSIQKRYGEGAIMRLGQAGHLQIDVIPPGSLVLDLALGGGGIPRGRGIEIFGPEGSGKTTLCQHIVAEAQAMGGVAAYIDMEPALDPSYAAKCGVDVDGLYISQPDTGEQALEIAEALVRSGAVDLVVIDSVAALVAGGGVAPKFYASVRLDMRRIESIKAGGEVLGNRTKVKVTKNKVAPPFRECEFDIMYAEGISKEGDVLALGAEMGLIEKRGSFYVYNGNQLAQGRGNAKKGLREQPALCLEIENAIRQQTGMEALDLAPDLSLDEATEP